MSWWDSKGLATFATKALQTAQKQIDKALDINEDASAQSADVSFSDDMGIGGDDFWGSYLGPDATSQSSKTTRENPGTTKQIVGDVFESPPSDSSQSASALTQKAKSLQNKMKASKRTIIEPADISKPTTEADSWHEVSILRDPEFRTVKHEEDALRNKGLPLKLGMKLGTNRKDFTEEGTKDDGIPAVSLSSAQIVEKLKREKEAEVQLYEMLGGDISSFTKSPSSAVATLDLEEPGKEHSVATLDLVSSVGEFGGKSPLFDMSRSSIMQDSSHEWGDDISLSVLVDSTLSIGDGTQFETIVSSEANSTGRDTAETIALTVTQAHTDDVTDEHVATGLGDATERQNLLEEVDIQPVFTNSSITELNTVDRESCSSLVNIHDNEQFELIGATYTDPLDHELICDNTENIPQVIQYEIEHASSETHDSVSVSVKSTLDTTSQDVTEDNVTQNTFSVSTTLLGDCDVTESTMGEKSLSFTMDGSQTSSSVDELSSSNRTLTTDDLQAMDNWQEISEESNDTVEPPRDDTHSDILLTAAEPSTSSDTEIEHIQSMESNVASSWSRHEDMAPTHGAIEAVTEHFHSSEDVLQSTEVDPCVQYDALHTEQQQLMVTSHSSQVSSSSSFVKNMLEEAMVESLRDNESHCDSTSHSSSDMVRIESGQNSEHTSADELETATSSDIEIISHMSTPTPNGGNTLNERPFELAGLRDGFSKIRRGSPPGHRRTDSDSSGFSIQSKNGDDAAFESISTVRRSERLHRREDVVKQSEQDLNNPYDTEKLLKKLGEMAEVLEAREKKLVELSRSNMDLTETSSILRNQLQQSEEARETELTDLNQLTDEFTARISEAERKLCSATKERDSLKKHSQDMESLLTKRSDASSSAQKMLLEKDQQIAELMEEGEKLSKQQLQSNNIIKKLRSKEKENETLMKSQKEKLEAQKSEMERLEKVLDNKCDVEKQQIDSITQLQAAVQKYEKDFDKVRTELEESSDRNRSLQAAIDNSYKEIAELHKANVMKASQVQEEKFSSEMQAKQELQIQLDRQLIQAKQEQEALLNQVEDLRLSLTRLEKEGARREDILRQEISDLQQRLQEAEDRNQDLTQGVSAATRPLLRQIENLQSTYKAQSASYERVERNLTERLTESQLSLATAQEKERVASEKLMEVATRLPTLETQLSSLRQDKSKLQAQNEMEKTKVEVLEDAKNNFVAQREALQHSYDQEISQLKKEKLLMENQCEMEKIRVEAEKKKAANIAEQLRDKEMQLSSMLVSRSSTPNDGLLRDSELPMISSMSSMNHSMTSSFFSTVGEDAMDRSFVLTPNGNKTNLYESLRNSGAASLMENLQSQLKQQDGEIVQLQNEIRELERTRESMAREMVNLSNANLEQSAKLEEYEELKKRYQELDQRYNALLQMYGEKVEEVQELKFDLSDVKDLYKSQIDELLTKH